MRVFAPFRNEFIQENISSGHFLVAVYTISSRDDFIPGLFHPSAVLNTGIKCHPGMKRGEKFHVNGIPEMKIQCVNSVCGR